MTDEVGAVAIIPVCVNSSVRPVNSSKSEVSE